MKGKRTKRATMANEQKQIRLSWTAISAFLGCQRKYELGYYEGIQAQKSAEDVNLILGSAFHAAMEGLLQYDWMCRTRDQKFVMADGINNARFFVNSYFETEIPKDKMYWNEALKQNVLDREFYTMIEDVKLTVREMVAYYLPRTGIGTRFRVANLRKVIPGSGDPQVDPVPAIEYKFEYPLSSNAVLTGRIDAILWDMENGHYVIADWKTRKAMPDDDLAKLDGQLHLYGAVFGQMQANIKDVVMWQFRTQVPKPAAITGKGAVSTAACDTTEEVWRATLPLGHRAEDYIDIMREKFHPETDYMRLVYGRITETSCKFVLDNARQVAVAIENAIKNESFPALYSSNGCRLCAFKRLCAGVFRYGGDATDVLERFYIRVPEAEQIEKDLKGE